MLCMDKAEWHPNEDTQGWFIPWTIKSDLLRCRFSMVWLNGPTSMVRFPKKLIYKVFGSLTRSECGTRGITMHQNVNVLIFFHIYPKRAFLEKLQVWIFRCLFLGLTCLHFLLNVVKMWFANLLIIIFTKRWAIKFVHVQCNLHVTCTLCCTLSIICNPLQHVYSNTWGLDVPHCLMKHLEVGSRGRAWKKWYVSWAMIWSRHIEGELASEDSLQYIDYEKCVLWALTSGKSCM